MSLQRTAVHWAALLFVLGLAQTGLAGEAVETLRARAQKGVADAQYCLGVLYEAGALLDLPQDHGQAARWFLRASEQGHANAQISLGHHYASGLGIPRDDVLALVWLEIGAAGASGSSRLSAKLTRKKLIPQMSLRQILDAQHKRRAWMTMQGELSTADSPDAPVLASSESP